MGKGTQQEPLDQPVHPDDTKVKCPLCTDGREIRFGKASGLFDCGRGHVIRILRKN